MLKDGETTFQELVMRRYRFYYQLHDVMNDHASTKRKVINYNLSNDTDDTDDIDDTDVDAAGDDNCNSVLHHNKKL